jgi:hypothetical protein
VVLIWAKATRMEKQYCSATKQPATGKFLTRGYFRITKKFAQIS